MTNLEMNVNGVPQNDEFECCSVTAGPYFSTYLASRNFGIRFSTDYDMAPPFAKDSRQRLHMLTFSLAACAVF